MNKFFRKLFGDDTLLAGLNSVKKSMGVAKDAVNISKVKGERMYKADNGYVVMKNITTTEAGDVLSVEKIVDKDTALRMASVEPSERQIVCIQRPYHGIYIGRKTRDERVFAYPGEVTRPNPYRVSGLAVINRPRV